MERPSFLKRRGEFQQDGPNKNAKTEDGAKKMSFAERMMAKQGWKKGEGLGKEASGIINPISVAQRPQGVGLGAVKEKTAQQKAEEKSQADKRGEEYEDSSEEERQSRKRRAAIKKAAGVSGVSSGASTPGRAARKTKFAITELEESGVHVPVALQSILDATGKEAKLLTSTAGLLQGTNSPVQSGSSKLADRARRDLEAYADAFNSLREEEITTEAQESQFERELDLIDSQLTTARELLLQCKKLETLDEWDLLVSSLETLTVEHRNEAEAFDVAVAALHPLFQNEMANWSPLDDPLENLPTYIQRLGLHSSPEFLSENSLYHSAGPVSFRPRKQTSAYESLIVTHWLPKVRSTVINQWDPRYPSSLVHLLETWKPVLPDFVYRNVIDSITSKLSGKVQGWSKRENPTLLPEMVGPWLPLLSTEQTDPSSASGLASDVRRRFRSLVSDRSLSRGPPKGLKKWRSVLRGQYDHILVTYVLPRLSNALRTEFEIDPTDQELDVFNHVIEWAQEFKSEVIGELFASAFFPQFFNILHSWLVSDGCVLTEVGRWLQWWRHEAFPENIRGLPAIAKKWNEALGMINAALDLGELVKTDLPLPKVEVEQVTSPLPRKEVEKEPASAKKELVEEATFKDVVESFCAEENLLLIPLREAHTVTGSPLFRITASATGRGGVIAYMRGDVLYAQNKKDKSAWEPIGLGDGLVEKAEGK